jgi:hypothetical protein
VARQGARRFDAEMADAEQEAERFRLRGRTIADALWEAMNRGDAVTVLFGERTLSGRLLGVRNDLALLDTGEAVTAVRTGAVDAVRLEAGGDGVAGDRTFGSFVAYVRMLMVDRIHVTVIGAGLEVVGVIEAVTPDHLFVSGLGDVRWVLPLRGVAAVVGHGAAAG